jgi:hypothetical protein
MAAEAARSGKVRTERNLFWTRTGLLMEGIYNKYGSMSAMAIFRQRHQTGGDGGKERGRPLPRKRPPLLGAAPLEEHGHLESVLGDGRCQRSAL